MDLWVSADGANFTQHTATNSFNQGSNNAQFIGFSPDLSAYTSAGALYFSLTSVAGTPIPLADEDILQYESATSKFKPVQLGVDNLSDVDTSTVAPTDGQALVWDNTAGKWEPGTVSGGGGGLSGRQTASAQTASIADGVAADLSITAAKSYGLITIQTSHAAWVTLYTDAASRTADASRTENTDALPGTGVIAEVITGGAATQLMTPGVFGFNNDSTPSTTVYAKVVNKSGSTQVITVTLTYTILEV